MLENRSILFIDTGITGYGGSFKSLFYTVNSLKGKFRHIYVVYLNTSEIVEQLKDNNVTLIKIEDPVYSKKRKISTRVPIYLKRRIERILPRCKPLMEKYIHWKTLSKIEKNIDFSIIDIIHFNVDPFRDFFGYSLCLKYNIPAVFHLRVFHGEENTESKLKLLNQKGNRFIAISRSIKTSWIKQGIEKDKIKTIPNFIKKDNSSDSVENQYDGNKILFLGRIEKNKGVSFLIDAFKLLPSTYTLYIVGDGSYMERIRQKIEKLQLVDRIFLEGYKKNTERYLRNSDILVVPSEREPFGRVVLEGMLNKIPVIASRVGGIVDIIEDGIDGYLIDYNDTNALSQKIIYLCNNNEVRRTIIENAYQKVTTIYSEKHYIHELLEVYKDLV